MDGDQGMEINKNERPKVANIIGLIAIIYCVAGLVMTAFGVVSSQAFSTIGVAAVEAAQKGADFLASVQQVYMLSLILTIVSSLIGIVGGIMLRSDNKMGPLVSIVFAVTSIITVLASLVVDQTIVAEFTIIVLEAQGLLAAVPAEQIEAMKTADPGGMGIISLAIFSIFPIITIVMMNRKDVKEYYGALA